MNETETLIKRVEMAILKTPTGELRNLLCDVNITLRLLEPGQKLPDFLKPECPNKSEVLIIFEKPSSEPSED